MSEIQAFTTEHDDRPVGGLVIDITPQPVRCTNATTGQAVTPNDVAPAWDCEAAGLRVTPEDQVAMRVRGTVAGGATDVGDTVTGLQPSSASCTNLRTGQQVQFRMMRGATAGSCVAAGLVVSPGDRLQLRVHGVAG